MFLNTYTCCGRWRFERLLDAFAPFVNNLYKPKNTCCNFLAIIAFILDATDRGRKYPIPAPSVANPIFSSATTCHTRSPAHITIVDTIQVCSTRFSANFDISCASAKEASAE